MTTLTDAQAELINAGANPLVVVNVPVNTAVSLQSNLSNQLALAGVGGTASNSAGQGNGLGSTQTSSIYRPRRNRP